MSLSSPLLPWSSLVSTTGWSSTVRRRCSRTKSGRNSLQQLPIPRRCYRRAMPTIKGSAHPPVGKCQLNFTGEIISLYTPKITRRVPSFHGWATQWKSLSAKVHDGITVIWDTLNRFTKKYILLNMFSMLLDGLKLNKKDCRACKKHLTAAHHNPCTCNKCHRSVRICLWYSL